MRKNLQIKAWILLILFISEIFSPVHLMALGSGPSQPEMASFTPAGTTELVDPFTGDFSYNIPLMDVEGYPINIAYNSGITMEQEASWVGLGWNLNVGAITRSVRGLPDDFKGDEMVTETKMLDMKITKVGVGTSLELFGLDNVGKKAHIVSPFTGDFGLSFIYNNYKGLGLALDASLGATSNPQGTSMAGIDGSVGLSLNSLDGATINSSLSAALQVGAGKNGALNFGGNLGSGYNTRTGQTIMTLGTTAGYSAEEEDDKEKKGGKSVGASATFLPIGTESYTPYPTLKMTSSTIAFSATVGGEIWGLNASGTLHGSQTIQKLASDSETSESYGYLYTEEASDNDLKDFNRDKQVDISPLIRNLSPVNFTYDIFSVSGQGVAGMFRPFRNDIGSVHDPKFELTENPTHSFGAEVGLGAYAKGGANYTGVDVNSQYGPWRGGSHSSFKFKGGKMGSQFEKVYWKAAGELTETDLSHYEGLYEDKAITFELDRMNTLATLIDEDGTRGLSLFNQKNENQRQARAKLLSMLTAEEAKLAGLTKDIYSYRNGFYAPALATDPIKRIGADEPSSSIINHRKAHHISEITQVNPDGERYVFGIAAYNNSKAEYNYNTAASAANSNGRIGYLQGEASTGNNAGVNHYYSKSTTPAYAHSFLLTAKQSNDYRDVTGDGISADDAGNAWKFNYTRTSDEYKWRVPYSDVNFMPGFRSDDTDEKASFSYGSKELWYLHTVESKNQVAEFRILPREDALGSGGESGGQPTSPSLEDRSYLLDEIVLYNKYDRIKNGTNAIPIKTIKFEYDYSLCQGVENQLDLGNDDKGTGKLTLKRILISHGESELGNLSPYVFDYTLGNSNNNPPYDPTKLDRWGNYKEHTSNPESMVNGDYPYVLQENPDADLWAGAWNLREIVTPSGGKITVSYEADDYGYVQDKRAMQMFPIEGAGPDETFSNSNKLKQGLDVNNHLFFRRPNSVSHLATQEELRAMFLNDDGKMDNLYFKFLLNIANGEPKEYAAGYVNAIDVGFASNSTNFIWVKIEEPVVSPFAPRIHPITETAWGYFRQNLFHILYDQPDINDNGVESILRGLAANITDIRQLFTGVVDFLISKEVANTFDRKTSFIRLNSPKKTKTGGGSRVSQIVMNDNWANMVGSSEGENSTYGQQYEYTTTDENGQTISSGVATYEPMVGNDENPFRQPIPYIASQGNGHIPAISAYQEMPMGETFFPSARVGYSKVVVKNIHQGVGKTANEETEHRFYTAKDFPVVVKETSLEKYHSPKQGASFQFPFSDQEQKSSFAATQGYSIVLNDMHGKPLSTTSYALITKNGITTKKINQGSTFQYHTKSTKYGKMLDNEVQVLTREGQVKNQLLGVEYDLAMDSRSSYEMNRTSTEKANFDVIPGLFTIPVPIPTYLNNSVTEIKELNTLVTTKVIQTYGIVESVTSFTDQYATTAYNRLYDGQTGNVLLTETEDEYGQNEFQFNNPAHLVDGMTRMGAASQNIHYENFFNPSVTQCNNEDVYINPGHLKHGDQLLVTPGPNSPHSEPFMVWVNSADKQCANFDVLIAKNKRRVKTSYVEFDGFPPLPSMCATQPIDVTSPLVLKGERGDILTNATVYHLKDNHVDFINNLNLNVSHDIFDNTSFCSNFSTLNANLTVFGAKRDFFMEVASSDFNQLEIQNLFDLNDPIGVEVEYTSVYYEKNIDNPNGPNDYKHYYYTETFHPCNPSPPSVNTFNFPSESHLRFKLDHFPQEDKYFMPHQILLVKYQIQLPNGGGLDDAYFLEYVTPYSDLHGSCPEYELEYVSPPPVTGNCINTYRVVDRDGVYVIDLDTEDRLKVVQSGNQNLLTAHTGSMVSTSNPLNIESGTQKFLGIKGSSTDHNILQTSAVNYSDCYTYEDQHTNGTASNQFLSGPDGKFKPKQSFRYLSPRHQKNSIENAKDGYVENEPDFWSRANDPVNFYLNAPTYDLSMSQASGWFLNEESLIYQQNGVSVEAKNAVDIHSAVLLTPCGKVEAVASNTQKSNVATESFENYEALSHTRNWNKHFGLLSPNTLPTIMMTAAGLDYVEFLLDVSSDQVFVSDIAHSGNHSMFLNGSASPSDFPLTISFDENNLRSLVEHELSDRAAAQQENVVFANISDYNTQKEAHHTNFKSYYWQTVPDDIKDAFDHAPSSWNMTINPTGTNQRFQPEGGDYWFSIWVKEPLSKGTIYSGVSPTVTITTDQGIYELKAKGEEIEGWQRIEGEFSFSSGDIQLDLSGGLWGTFYDDMRIHPIESNLKTYVYDALSGRLKATLDENNYTTFYEYDIEGIPTQVKRETPRGILTVSESRQSTQK